MSKSTIFQYSWLPGQQIIDINIPEDWQPKQLSKPVMWCFESIHTKFLYDLVSWWWPFSKVEIWIMAACFTLNLISLIWLVVANDHYLFTALFLRSRFNIYTLNRHIQMWYSYHMEFFCIRLQHEWNNETWSEV